MSERRALRFQLLNSGLKLIDLFAELGADALRICKSLCVVVVQPLDSTLMHLLVARKLCFVASFQVLNHFLMITANAGQNALVLGIVILKSLHFLAFQLLLEFLKSLGTTLVKIINFVLVLLLQRLNR